MMETFRKMLNDCIRIGLERDVVTMRRLCQLSYDRLAVYDIMSYYKVCAISRAAAMLSNRKKSIKRGYDTRVPYARKRILTSCYGLKVENGILKVPTGKRRHACIPLNSYTNTVLADRAISIRSFTIVEGALSICYSREMEVFQPAAAIGIDRNLANVTAGNSTRVHQYDLTKVVDIAENSRSVIRAFKRNDARVRRYLASRHGQRRRNRIQQLLNNVSKSIVRDAKEHKSAIVLENISQIRHLYRRGNFQGRDHHAIMNAWPYDQLRRQIEYKSAWEGVPVIQLSKFETRGTSKLCPRCGKRTQVATRTDVMHKRQLWCESCRKWLDRDVTAVMNISRKGLQRFCSPQGAAGEAMVQESGSKEPVILKVDAAKLCLRLRPRTWQDRPGR